MSHVKRSLSCLTNLIRECLQILIDNSASTKVWTDPGSTTYHSVDGFFFNINFVENMNTVADLMSDGSWNLTKLQELFHPLLVTRMLNIHVPSSPYNDA